MEHFARTYLGLGVGYTTLFSGSGILGLTVDSTILLDMPQTEPGGRFAIPENTVLADKCLKTSGNYARLRFTIAHELAHHILLRAAGDRSDRWANALAAALLMPGATVERLMFPAKHYTSYDGRFNAWDYQRIRRLAESLCVSVSAMIIRLRTLELIKYKPVSEYTDPLNISA